MIKTIQTNKIEELEQAVNDFEAKHQVFATQTHVTYDMVQQRMLYTAILFHKGAK